MRVGKDGSDRWIENIKDGRAEVWILSGDEKYIILSRHRIYQFKKHLLIVSMKLL